MASYSDTFTPPAEVAKIARAALEAHDKGVKGGTLVGLARARQLANREPMSLRTIRRGHSFFARHEGEGQLPGPARTQAKRLWGGEVGQRWFDSIWAKHREDVIKSEGGSVRSLGVGALLVRSLDLVFE